MDFETPCVYSVVWVILKTMEKLLLLNFSKWPTWRTIPWFYTTFITVLYMFRATSCSSSGG